MANVLIATLWEKNPIMRTITHIGIQRVYVLIDIDPKKEQVENFQFLKESFKGVVDVKKVPVPKLDIYEIAKKTTELIDMQPQEDKIYVNPTAGIKTVALGVLYGCYARTKYIEQIIYNPDPVHGENALELPKLSFRLTDTQKKVLDYIAKGNFKQQSYADIADAIVISRAMLYKNLDDLRNLGFVTGDKDLTVTDAGKIARLQE